MLFNARGAMLPYACCRKGLRQSPTFATESESIFTKLQLCLHSCDDCHSRLYSFGRTRHGTAAVLQVRDYPAVVGRDLEQPELSTVRRSIYVHAYSAWCADL